MEQMLGCDRSLIVSLYWGEVAYSCQMKGHLMNYLKPVYGDLYMTIP